MLFRHYFFCNFKPYTAPVESGVDVEGIQTKGGERTRAHLAQKLFPIFGTPEGAVAFICGDTEAMRVFESCVPDLMQVV